MRTSLLPGKEKTENVFTSILVSLVGKMSDMNSTGKSLLHPSIPITGYAGYVSTDPMQPS